MPKSGLSNEQWLEALASERQREPAAAELHDFLRRSLARGFGRQLSDADLDDLAQDAVLRTLARIDDFRGDSRFTTWATSIAVNLALGQLRKRKHATTSLDDAVAAGRAALEAPALGPAKVQSQQAHRLLYAAIDSVLSDKQRSALLAELGGLPLMEIARRQGQRRGTLYKMLHDARKKLRAHFETHGLHARDLLGADLPGLPELSSSDPGQGLKLNASEGAS